MSKIGSIFAFNGILPLLFGCRPSPQPVATSPPSEPRTALTDTPNSQGPEWTVYDTENSGLLHNKVFPVAFDAQGNTWIPTYGGGLAKFDGTNWTVYTTANSGLPFNYVLALAIDDLGNIWSGCWNGTGLTKFDGETWTVYDSENSGLPHNGFVRLNIDARGNLWIGTYGGGLAVYREGGVK